MVTFLFLLFICVGSDPTQIIGRETAKHFLRENPNILASIREAVLKAAQEKEKPTTDPIDEITPDLE